MQSRVPYTYGPNITETYKNNPALITFMDLCTKYVSNLSPLDKFCVWRYTIGSASVNSNLITGQLSSNAHIWTYQFFKYYENTFKKNYFYNSKDYLSYPLDKQILIAKKIISNYTFRLQSIILNGPKTPEKFHVFKVSSSYPGLPKSNSELPVKVLQFPFNSTTITPHFNFAMFIQPDSTCCLFDILIPKGSSCLYVPQEYHAYPFEMEIILPHDCLFNIKSISTRTLDYIDPKSVNMVQIQSKEDIKIGSVFNINEYFPCGNSTCIINKKNFTVYNAVYNNPI